VLAFWWDSAELVCPSASSDLQRPHRLESCIMACRSSLSANAFSALLRQVSHLAVLAGGLKYFARWASGEESLFSEAETSFLLVSQIGIHQPLEGRCPYCSCTHGKSGDFSHKLSRVRHSTVCTLCTGTHDGWQWDSTLYSASPQEGHNPSGSFHHPSFQGRWFSGNQNCFWYACCRCF